MTKMQGGKERIITVKIENLSKPTVLINVYMPTQGYRSSKNDYSPHIDMLIALGETQDCDAIIAGDMNAFLYRTPPSPCDKKLAEMIQSCGLEHASITEPTSTEE